MSSVLPGGSISEFAHCLVVDDDAQVRQALVRVVESQGLGCLQAGSALEALTLIERIGSIPLIISDIRMAEMDGVELLRELRARHPDTAVIMLTAVADVKTAVTCLQMGASDYLIKPVAMDEVKARVMQALERRNLLLQNRYYQKNLESRVNVQAQRIKEMFLEGVQALAHALDAKDPYTRGHSRRVSMYASKAAVRLGFTGDALEHIRLGGELHDIGKIDTPESILNKPGPLTPEEFERVTRHTVLGEKILAAFVRETPAVLRIVRSHHERLDGRGFPDGLKGDLIPFEARIVSVADAFDAMTTSRAYRATRAPADAMRELERCSGSQFDPSIVTAFVASFPDPSKLPLEY
jgi:putative two-component system response regulator